MSVIFFTGTEGPVRLTVGVVPVDGGTATTQSWLAEAASAHLPSGLTSTSWAAGACGERGFLRPVTLTWVRRSVPS